MGGVTGAATFARGRPGVRRCCFVLPMFPIQNAASPCFSPGVWRSEVYSAAYFSPPWDLPPRSIRSFQLTAPLPYTACDGWSCNSTFAAALPPPASGRRRYGRDASVRVTEAIRLRFGIRLNSSSSQRRWLSQLCTTACYMAQYITWRIRCVERRARLRSCETTRDAYLPAPRQPLGP